MRWRRIGPRPTLIEWDTAMPPLETLVAEAGRPTRASCSWGSRAMRALPEVQADFAAAVLGEDTRAVVGLIVPDGLPSAARLQVYRNHVFSSLTEALETTYPVVCRLVDRRFFGFAADRYIRRHPPAGPCLFEYGATFPEFLAAFPPCAEHPYLADVARLEWAMNEAYNATDDPALDAAALAGIPAEHYAALRFVLRPSCRFVASAYPVKPIWLANQADAAAETIDFEAGGAALLVMRRDFDVMLLELEPSEFAFLAALDAGKTVEAAFADAVAQASDFDLAETLARQFARGSFAQVCLSVAPDSSPS